MNAIQFIQKYGIDKAREVIDGAPDETVTRFDLTIDGFCFYDKNFVKVYMEDYELYHLTSLKELKRLVDSFDFIKKFGGDHV